MTTFTVIVDGLSRQGRHAVALSLVRDDGEPLPRWEAGAHIDLQLGNGMVRQYSLTGSPMRQDRYLICVGLAADSRGGSRYIHQQLRLGQRLSISAPRNLFPLVAAQRVVLIAAGIGLTPLLAMAAQLDADGVPFSLHYYVKQRQDVALARHLLHPFRHGYGEILCSAEGKSPRQHLPEPLRAPVSGAHLYLCGPQGFMTHLQQQAQALGWRAEQVHTEAFSATLPPSAQENGESFTVTLASTGASWPVPAEKTIARVLLENGVDVPLSCEMGLCGACLTPVLSGEADHRDTVQSEEEKSAPRQQIALCCSRSRSKALVIDL
ncbi:MAG TPA: xanthine hydroxylase reductase [Pantoea sp.]|uniref:PDR/VanB family oxidoreductase n=1 Tax=Pantoea piersonii TaxID=2364647 RepID=UPI000ED9CD30|nr:PDR/VanB family oxidoreductase [Pantoea piersonii]HCW97635.1 xanthine hydroxylase reductase [Pantoea sp.]